MSQGGCKKKIPAMERVVINAEVYYKHDLQLYKTAPCGWMNFDDLEKLVVDRLLILRTVKEIAEANDKRSSQHCRKKLIARLRVSGYESFADLCEGTGYSEVHTEERYEARRRDHLSQYTLLLCMSQAGDMENWIQETEFNLFKWRLSALNSRGIRVFNKLNKFGYTMLSADEKNTMKKYLKREMKHPSLFHKTNFFKVPALEILAERRMYLKAGIAYATESQMCTAFEFQYKTLLRSQVQKWKSVRQELSDPRIHAIKKTVNRIFRFTKPVSFKVGKASVDDLDELAETSYPPCMRRLHEGLRKTHHLHYKARVQYTLYLKGMGIPAEDAVEFYRSEFTKNIADSDFNKKYVYGFQHLYGLKGSKINYSVPTCRKIAEEMPSRKDFHGCPLATADIEDLSNMLVRWNIDPSAKSDIINMAKKNKCADACARYFEATHEDPIYHTIQTPMDFYTQSVTMYEGEAEILPKPVASARNVDEESEESDSSDCTDDSDYESQIMDPKNLSDDMLKLLQSLGVYNMSADSDDDCIMIDFSNDTTNISDAAVEPDDKSQTIDIIDVPDDSDDDCQIIGTNSAPKSVPVDAPNPNAFGVKTEEDEKMLTDCVAQLYEDMGVAYW